MQFTYFLGIDISKKTVDVSLCDASDRELMSKQVKNTSATLLRFLEEVLTDYEISPDSVLVGCEATGSYTSSLRTAVCRLGISLVIEPHWKFVSVLNSRIKTDRIDARRISKTLCRDHADLHLWEADTEVLTRLRSLVGIRDQLTRTLNGIKVSTKEAKASESKIEYEIRSKHSKASCRALQADIDRIEADIDLMVKQEEEISTNYKLLTSIPGVGKQNAIALIIYTQNFTRFLNARQLACYCGVAPFEKSSGTSYHKRARVSHKANKKLKSLLYMASMAAKRYNPKLAKFYNDKIKKGKHSMSALTAVANKLLHIAFAVVKNQEPYCKNYQAKYNFAPST